jgi:DNA-binding CsgD family transcriptional regulator
MQTAQDRFEEAVAVMRQTDVGFLPSAFDHLVAVGALVGAQTANGAIVDDAARFPLYESERVRLAGVEAAGRGDLARARELALEAYVVARRQGLHMLELFALWDHARWGGAHIVGDELQRVASTCEGALAPILAAATRAWCADDAIGLESSARDLELLGFVLWAGELNRLAAGLFAEAGLFARATGADLCADRLIAECEGVSTPLTGRRREVPELTPRERDIAELAARGTTNAEIARRLAISVRTVETHLQHVYGKLGVSSRRELAASLVR